MTQEAVKPKKRRGPVPTGKGTPVMVRLQPDLLGAVDAYIQQRAAAGEQLTRPEALRRVAALGLEVLGVR